MVARVDSCHESQDGKVGYELKEDIEGKFDKWQEPTLVKLLPLPLHRLRGKREGQGARRWRNTWAWRRSKNRPSGLVLGRSRRMPTRRTLGSAWATWAKPAVATHARPRSRRPPRPGSAKPCRRPGRSRVPVYGGKSTILQLAHSLEGGLHTPAGLEIVNQQVAEKKVAEAGQKYFSSMAECLKVKGNKNGVPIPPTPLGIPKSHPMTPKFPRIAPQCHPFKLFINIGICGWSILGQFWGDWEQVRVSWRDSGWSWMDFGGSWLDFGSPGKINFKKYIDYSRVTNTCVKNAEIIYKTKKGKNQ